MPSKEDRQGARQGDAPNPNGAAGYAFNARAIVLALGMLLILLVCAGVGFAIYELRLRELNEEQRTLTAIDLLLVAETEDSLQSVDLVLRNVVEKLIADNLTAPQQFAAQESDRATHEMLKSRLIGVPQLDALTLISAAGRIVNFSRSFPTPDINVADRDYFRALKDAPSDRAFISQPFQDRPTGAWTTYLARRVTSPSGQFLGLVIGGIDLAYLENLYRTLQIGKGSAVSLWRADGTLLARYPSRPGMDRILKSTHLAGADQTTHPVIYEIDQSGDGPARVIATMAAQQFPIVVNVSKAMAQIQADRNQVVTVMAAGTFICIIALSFVLWLLMRQFKTYEALALAHEERSKAVAEREQAEAQLRQAQKLEAIGQLTGGIAHDFNNLLTAVLGNLELLKKHTEMLDTRLHRWVNNAYDAANRGAVLTQRLLVFSRRQPLDPRATNVATLLASMSDLLERTLGESIEVTTDIPPGLWLAFADVNQLDNAILNIAINARDAMEGRGRLTIAAHNCNIEQPQGAGDQEIGAGQYVMLAFTDTGKGIEQHVLERVFEPFFSTKPVGQGTGLGLSQVYGFIKQTGGHVRIRSEPGESTTVELYLPRATQNEITAAAPADVEEPIREERIDTILVVEDDQDVRAYSVEVLNELGFRVREASDAKAALDMLRTDPGIDLLFSDIGLPGMTGAELMHEALRLRPKLKILLTTGYAQDEVMDHSRAERGALLITKPFGRADIAEKVRTLLASSPQQCV